MDVSKITCFKNVTMTLVRRYIRQREKNKEDYKKSCHTGRNLPEEQKTNRDKKETKERS